MSMSLAARQTSLLLLAFSSLIAFTGCDSSSRAEQPIEFKHKIHVAQLEIPCTHCHVGVEEADHATIPTRDICLQCHEEALGESAEEARLVKFLATDKPIPWNRVTRVAEHVHFSHRRHVVAGGIICETCHGQVAEMEAPFSQPFINYRGETGMERCIGCHLASGNPRAVVDCTLCHR
jgi:hypothetical protein